MSIDVATVKKAAHGRWAEIISGTTTIDRELLDGAHHPCPKCGGTDRFRFDPEKEFAICNQCFNRDNGDGLSAIQWITGASFPDTLKLVADHLHLNNGHALNGNSNGKAKTVEQKVSWTAASTYDHIGQWCQHKPPVTPEAVKAAGGQACDALTRKCVGFRATRDFKSTSGVIVYRADGQQFPAFKSLGERKTHNIAGSKDGWVVCGGKTALDAAEFVWAVEGIPDALSLHPLLPEGHVAVTNICGAGARKSLPMGCLKGKQVRAIGDADQPGADGVVYFAEAAARHAADVRIVQLPYPTEPEHGKDLRDFILEGGTFAQLMDIAEKAEPIKPEPTGKQKQQQDDGSEITNYVAGDYGAVPLPMGEIIRRIRDATDNWPRRVATALFVHEHGTEISWLERSAQLFGFIGSKTDKPPRFVTEDDAHTKSEVFAECQRTATAYRAVEVLPHEPALDGHYYACPTPEPGDGSHLQWLIDRFAPETPIDGDLIRSLLVTPFWGGPAGARPAFVLTADEGRGCGKTVLAAMSGWLSGGAIELSANENAEIIKQRILSPEGITKRVVLLDNVKSHRFSWADLEGLITCPVVSGKRLYVGEWTRPNVLTWCVTLNGVSLAKDMAQRSVIIKLRRPKYSGTWAEDTRAYIAEHRQAIIGDIITFLRSERSDLQHYTRWGAWEQDILSRLPEPADAQAVILDRQGAVDVEREESDLIETYFAERLASLAYDTNHEVVFIPTKVAADWLSAATNERHSTISAGRQIGQKIDEREISRLQRAGRAHGRGFKWVGPEARSDATINSDICTRIAHQFHREREDW